MLKKKKMISSLLALTFTFGLINGNLSAYGDDGYKDVSGDFEEYTTEFTNSELIDEAVESDPGIDKLLIGDNLPIEDNAVKYAPGINELDSENNLSIQDDSISQNNILSHEDSIENKENLTNDIYSFDYSNETPMSDDNIEDEQEEENSEEEEVGTFNSSGSDVIWGEDADYNWSNNKCTINDIKFKLSGSNAVITDCNENKSGELILPSKIKVNNTYYPIVSIEDGAFGRCTNITSITIPKSITSIGECICVYCNNLQNINVDDNNQYYTDLDGVLFDKNITRLITYPAKKENTNYIIPSSVVNIDDLAFYNSSNLKGEITIPSGVTAIKDETFCGCSSLSKINIPDTVQEIGVSAFGDCWNLTGEMTVPSGVTDIKDYTFAGCSSLSKINIPDTVQKIGQFAFSYCSSLKGEITVPSGVTDIKDNTFYECRSLSKINIPDTVQEIGKSAFSHCTSLKGEITIPSGVTAIKDCAFDGCTNITSITIPKSVTSIGTRICVNCDNLQNINVDDNNQYYTDLNGVLFDKNMTRLITYPAKKENTNYIIPSSVVNIDDSAFFNSSNLKGEITIPSGVTAIKDETFCGCSSLSKINIPDTVQEIGELAFCGCWNLKGEMTVPSGVAAIKDCAFDGCTNITSITIPKSVTSIGLDICVRCNNLQNINVDDNNEYYTDLNGVLFDKNITRLIMYPAKKENINYIIPSSVVNIDDSAFYNSSNLKGEITIPSGVTAIKKFTFDGCSSLSKINIPDTVQELGYSAFFDCSSLTRISLPSNLKTLSINVFGNCINLKSISIPDSLSSISTYTFYNCNNIESVWASESEFEQIKEAFKSNPKLIESNLYNRYNYKDDVIKIKADSVKCFERCNDGTVKEIKLTKDNDGNYIHDPFRSKSGTRNYYYEAAVDGKVYESPVISVQVNDENVVSSWNNSMAAINGVTYYKNSDNTVTLRSCDANISGEFIVPSSVTIDEQDYKVTGIDDNAFNGCLFLTNIKIPEFIDSIGENAFEGCLRLENIDVDDTNNSYSSAEGILYNKDKTALIKYPEGRKDMEYNLPGSISEIKDNTLSNCSSLKVIWMPIEKYDLFQTKLPDTISGANNLAENKAYNKNTQAEPLKVKGNDVKWFTKNENGEVNTFDEGSITTEDGYSICTPSTGERGILEYYAEITIDNNIYTSPSIKVETYADVTEGEDEKLTTDENGGVTTTNGMTVTLKPDSSKNNNDNDHNDDNDDNKDSDSNNNGTISDIDKNIEGDVTIPGGIVVDGKSIPLTEIGAQAFAECENMKKLEIPSTIEKIDSSAFMGCKSLEEIKVNPDNPYYCNVDGVLYNKDKTVIIVYPAGKTDESYTILDSTAHIGENSFYNAVYLKSIDMSDNVVEIGKNAFTSCTGLENIRLSEGITKIKDVIFNGCPSLESIVIPSNVTSLGAKVFTSCKNLITAKVPSGASVNKKAFYRCNSNLQVIEY